MRERKVGEIVKVVQAAARGWVERKRFRQAREKSISARIIQDNIRAYLEFKNWPWWKLFSKVRPMLTGKKLDKELKEKESEIKNLTSQLQAEKTARAELEKQLKDAEKKIAELTEALKAEKQKVAALQDENDDLKAAKLTAERKVHSLEGELGMFGRWLFVYSKLTMLQPSRTSSWKAFPRAAEKPNSRSRSSPLSSLMRRRPDPTLRRLRRR